jgi:hypothetical protein
VHVACCGGSRRSGGFRFLCGWFLSGGGLAVVDCEVFQFVQDWLPRCFQVILTARFENNISKCLEFAQELNSVSNPEKVHFFAFNQMKRVETVSITVTSLCQSREFSRYFSIFDHKGNSLTAGGKCSVKCRGKAGLQVLHFALWLCQKPVQILSVS